MLKLKSLLLVSIFPAFAWSIAPFEPGSQVSQSNNTTGNSMNLKAANCSPATGRLSLELNNVRTIIETSGLLWNDRINSAAGYQVPKISSNDEPNTNVIYAGGLWMGGTDVNGQLKLAGVTYRVGNDYWAGPLSATQGTGNFQFGVPGDATLRRDFGIAEITPDQCSKYDEFYTMRRAEVQQFIAWWNCQNGITDPDNCDDVTIDGEVLRRIEEWPAHGDVSLGEDFYLAPFYDNPNSPNGLNGVYDPIVDGDYPWYDLEGEIDCRNDRRITLFGDETHWWVFNDKGNIHTESGADPIGMEIRAQAFAFATDDQVNNMTFYNFELINRSTQTLQDTYFGQYADPDVGCFNDDFVGCDVGRGLAYVYNSTNNDQSCSGAIGYGQNPPAIGIDFFEGPYQDNDGLDNAFGISAGEALNGLGYGDGVPDNERFGMRRFVYYNNASIGSPPPATTDPDIATHFYNYMRGFWKDGSRMLYGGTGYAGGASTTIEADFMFPDDTDTLNWGTSGVDPGFDWSEESEGNQAGDRRFIQAAGPFTLEPGAVNNITVGVVYGRSPNGNLASIDLMKIADTKAQALFDNCFKIVQPPPAPELTAQELENEIILYLSNPPGSPNENEDYFVRDRINIITPDSLAAQGEFYNDTFKFEGYQIYQLKSGEVSVADLKDTDLARLVAQCDIKNGVTRLVNYEFNEQLALSFPSVMVEGEDEGLRHSFKITSDLFSTSDNPKLVNHKQYFYLAVSYAFNQYKEYDPEDPLKLDGQRRPYLRSRNMADGSEIASITVVPSAPLPSNGGQVANSNYGDGPRLTRIDGTGNGGNILELTPESEQFIINNSSMDEVTYEGGFGPVNIKVVDPLNVQPGDYTFKMLPSNNIDTAAWMIVNNTLGDTVFSDRNIDFINEQLILDWGISVQIEQVDYRGTPIALKTDIIDVSLDFSDSSKLWLTGVEDGDNFFPTNWLASGTNTVDDPALECDATNCNSNACDYVDYDYDPEQEYDKMLNGIVAPFRVVRHSGIGGTTNSSNACPPGMALGVNNLMSSSFYSSAFQNSNVADNQSIDIVFTDSVELWTRCPVIELGNNPSTNEGGVQRGLLRAGNSVGPDGQPDGSGTGMGWFPGYAINLETGERMNMAFGENSGITGAGDNGRDMIWNPTDRLISNTGTPIFGGMHYIYVFGSNEFGAPAYDNGSWMYDKLSSSVGNDHRQAWSNCQYVMASLLAEGQELLASEARLRIRIAKKYEQQTFTGDNNGLPMYNFNMDDLAPRNMDAALADSAMLRINVVPNPYYAYSQYETDRLDNRIKITNLPEVCTISIFNTGGALVRRLTKDSPARSLDWDMKNEVGIPIAGGVYIIHVEDAEGREAIVKWFGALRPADLENF